MHLLKLTVLLVLVIDVLLMLSLIVGKKLHRISQLDYRKRRSTYLALLSRALTNEETSEGPTPRLAGDPAFVDALIDIRTSVNGPEVERLDAIAGRHGVMDEYARNVASKHFLTRRLRSAVALAELADDSWAETLMGLLEDREPEIRIQAARGLARMRWTPSIDAIVDRLGREEPWVRSRLEDALLEFGSRATWPLLAYARVNHPFDSEGPASAIRTIASIGDPGACEGLVEILEEARDPEVQLATIETLGVLGVPTAGPAIAEKFRSADWRLRAKAATALARLGPTVSIPVIAQGIYDSNWWVRRNSAKGLARHRLGIECLHAALRSDDVDAKDAAAEALFDAGEVVAAKRRVEEGVASPEDVRLLNYVDSEMAVA